MALEASKRSFNPVYCQHGKIFFECKEGCNKAVAISRRILMAYSKPATWNHCGWMAIPMSGRCPGCGKSYSQAHA